METTLLVISVGNLPAKAELKRIRTHIEDEFKACGLSVDFIVIPDHVDISTHLISHVNPVSK